MPLPPIHQRVRLLLAGAFASRCTTILIAPLPLIHPHLASFPCIIIEQRRRPRARMSNFQMFQFRLTQKWDRCSPQRANCAKARRKLIADSVSRLMVRGREHSTTESGRTMVRSGRVPISYLSVSHLGPESTKKLVQVSTYNPSRRLTKLVPSENLQNALDVEHARKI